MDELELFVERLRGVLDDHSRVHSRREEILNAVSDWGFEGYSMRSRLLMPGDWIYRGRLISAAECLKMSHIGAPPSEFVKQGRANSSH